MLTKDSGICIRAVDYSETSQVVTFFTRGQGKLSAIAKGSKRSKSSFGGPIELFSEGELVFSDTGRDGLVTLTEFEERQGFGRLSGNLVCLNCASLGIELLRELTNEKDSHHGLYDGLVRFLQNAKGCRGRLDALKVLIKFELTLLREVGLLPVFQRCVSCKRGYDSKWPQVYFSSSANGFICRDCEGGFVDKVRISRECGDVLSDFNRLVDANQETVERIEELLVSYFQDVLGKPLKTARYVITS